MGKSSQFITLAIQTNCVSAIQHYASPSRSWLEYAQGKSCQVITIAFLQFGTRCTLLFSSAISIRRLSQSILLLLALCVPVRHTLQLLQYIFWSRCQVLTPSFVDGTINLGYASFNMARPFTPDYDIHHRYSLSVSLHLYAVDRVHFTLLKNDSFSPDTRQAFGSFFLFPWPNTPTNHFWLQWPTIQQRKSAYWLANFEFPVRPRVPI